MKKLYRLLLEPLEDDLPEGYPGEIMLVLDADLYLVPFAMLKTPTAQVSSKFHTSNFVLRWRLLLAAKNFSIVFYIFALSFRLEN